MLLFRNAKTGDIAVGAENKVEQCHYAAVITRVEDDLANELTGGWKVMEVCLLLYLLRRCQYSYFVLDGSQICSGIFVVPIVLASGWTGHCAQFAIPTRHIPHSQSHPIHYSSCFACRHVPVSLIDV